MNVVFVSMMVSKDENIIHLVEPVMRILMAKMDTVDKINFKLNNELIVLNSVQCESSASCAHD